MNKIDSDLLIPHLCSAAVDAARRAMLHFDERNIANFYVLYVHPSWSAYYQQWAGLIGLPEEVVGTLLEEYGEAASYAFLDEQPYRVVIWPRQGEQSSWQLRPEHFYAAASGEVLAYALHITDADWRTIAGELAKQDDFCGALWDDFQVGNNGELIQNWSPKMLMTPLHVDLHFLYAIALYERGGSIPGIRPPFNSVAGILSFIEESPCFYIALVSLLRGYGNPEMRWHTHIGRALAMLGQVAEEGGGQADPPHSPFYYWQEVLGLLQNLGGDLQEAGAGRLLARLDKLDADYGLRHSAILRFPPLLFAYLWALAQSGMPQAKWFCRFRLEYEARHCYGGKVFQDESVLRNQWHDFSCLLPAGDSLALAGLAEGLLLSEAELVGLLAG
jgi:hypothetical protein